ncbi:hypothetical protein GOQ29_05465 [Clostridium sp. D2Q-14]|uniref:hypothetical protein n=1 Tax=Anaeromonas gelatinilytica TaxID=2683194 RepID=UPI00193BDF9C|nr:hypothetical protein [Anaeromonas gelatinilytica]MBS4535067.1 hypothetical protein [Anaeromonas gelatinilytica]
MEKILNQIAEKLNDMDGRFDAMEERLDGMDGRFDVMEKRLDGMDGRFDVMEKRLDGMDERFDAVEKRFDCVEDKMTDGFNKVNEDIEKLNNRITEEHEITREETKHEIQYVHDKITDLNQDFSTVKIVTADNMRAIAKIQSKKDSTKM